jgi:hypothetical protein
MGTSARGWKIKQLSKEPNDIATDFAFTAFSEVRKLSTLGSC